MGERVLPEEVISEQKKVHDLPIVTASEQKILYSMLKSLNEINGNDKYIIIENYDENSISLIKGNNTWIAISKEEDEIVTKEYDSCVNMTIDIISKLTDTCEEKKEALARCITNLTEIQTHNAVAEYVDNYTEKRTR